VVQLALRDFMLGGVSLEGQDKERFNVIQQELVQLSTKFSNNVLDATNVRSGLGGGAGGVWEGWRPGPGGCRSVRRGKYTACLHQQWAPPSPRSRQFF